MTDDEKQLLETQASELSSNRVDLAGVLFSLFLATVSLTFAAVLAWLLIAWLAELLTDARFGWNSPYRTAILGALAALAAGYAGITVYRLGSSMRTARARLAADIENGAVIEESMRLVDARALQEPEHGGLIYFLKTATARIFVIYDEESQALGAAGKDPWDSSFEPRDRLRIIRAAESNEIIREAFDGAPLEIADALPMTARPALWPDSHEYLDAEWSEIDERYCG